VLIINISIQLFLNQNSYKKFYALIRIISSV
jgi:hypothetical protein